MQNCPENRDLTSSCSHHSEKCGIIIQIRNNAEIVYIISDPNTQKILCGLFI